MAPYRAVPDPYCYSGTTILRNRPGIRDQAALDRYEAFATADRAATPFPSGRLSVQHYRAVHHHLFQDVYRWAGRFRTIRMSKGGNMFCYPEHIAREMKRLFADLAESGFMSGLSADAFAGKAAHFLAELNAIHPFREGNGRTQLAFFGLVALRAGHDVVFTRLDRNAFLAAVIESFGGKEDRLAAQLRGLIDG